MEFLVGIKPREYQKKIFETCMEKNCLVILPTGLGKTLIALMLTIDRLTKFPNEKVVFLAPTKPLTEQHFSFFKKHLTELFASMTLFTGEVKAEKRRKLWQNSDIIFSTPQCIANDLKNKLYNLENVSLLIEDEAHRCVKNYDYTYIAKCYKTQAKHQRILGLTASPGSEYEKIKEICKNLSIEEVEIRIRESTDVKPYLQELKVEKEIIEFPEEFKEIRNALLKIFSENIEELKNRNLLFVRPTKTNLIKLQKNIFSALSKNKKNFNYLLGASACSTAIKIHHALELLETQTLSNFNNYLKNLFKQASEKKNKGVRKLVSKPEFNFVFLKTNELIIKNFEHPKLKRLKEIVIKEKDKNKNIKILIFTQFRETAKIIVEELNKIKGIKTKIFVGQVKKEIGGEVTGLNQKEQKKIIEEFSQGKINVLCATSIGEEGLDIPEVNIVIFYETIPSAIRKIQRSGRTARLIKGKLIILVTKKTRDETNYYVSKAKEKKMNFLIENMKKKLSNEIKQKTIKDYLNEK